MSIFSTIVNKKSYSFYFYIRT